MPRIIAACYVILIVACPTTVAAQSVYLQSNRIFADDIAELIIEFDNKIPSLYALDTSVLEADFEILEVRSSVSRMFEAGNAFHRMRWQIDILPLRTGNLEVPPLRVGDIYTPTLALEVMPQTPVLNAANNVRVELEAEPENPYLGQQVKIAIRVVHNVSLFDGGLIEPDVANAETYRHGPESSYRLIREGSESRVLERRFSIIPLASGELRIPPAIYRGRIRTGAGLATDGSGSRSRRINRASAPLQLNVRQPPAEYSGIRWLPAQQLVLDLDWDPIDGDLQVGDSVGLTLSIEARGLAAASLPGDLLSIEGGGIRIYADQETRSNRFDNRVIVGRLEQRFVMVITEPGEIQFPAIVLKWWDVDQQIEKIASTESQRWAASLPAAGQTGSATIGTLRGPAGSSPGVLKIASIPALWSVYLGIGAALLFTCLLWFLTPMRRHLRARIEPLRYRRRVRASLKQACTQNDPARARDALIEWGRARWPGDNINGIHQILSKANSASLADELHRLSASLYANRDSDWQGRQLWRLLRDQTRGFPGYRTIPARSLPALYPERSQVTRI